jgi:transcription elongation factor Elf1
MKIIEKKPLGEKVVGVFECTQCKSKLEVQIKDCVTGNATDYSGDSDPYAGFHCPVCGSFQSNHRLPMQEIEDYHKTAKAIEERRKTDGEK